MRRLVSAVVGSIVLVFAARPAAACFDLDAPPEMIIRFTSPTTAELTVTGLVVTAAGLPANSDCAVGLGHSGLLMSAVTSVSVVDAGDTPPSPVTEFAFTPNGNTTSDLTTAVPGTTWQGFHATTTGPLSGGTIADLAFTVTVPAGTTALDIQTDVASDGLLASDDATAAGNLAGTNQQIEPIGSFVEQPDCYNDVIDPGEVCDGLSNLGCTAGMVCAQCTACVLQNLPNTCKGTTLKTIGLSTKAKLKCWASKAKQGLTVDPACLAPAANLVPIYWLKAGASPAACPLFPSFPASSSIETTVDTFDTQLAALLPLGTTSGAWKCAAKKFKVASVRATGKLNCYVKTLYQNLVVDPVCLSKADLKFNTSFARAETPGLCDPGDVGNGGPVGTLVDGLVNNVVSAIPPP